MAKRLLYNSGTGVGYIGIFMKKVSSFPPWMVYTGLAGTIMLIIVSFGLAASQGMLSDEDDDTSRSDSSKPPSSPRTRKSRKAD